MKQLFLFAFLAVSIPVMAQDDAVTYMHSDYTVSKDAENGEVVYKGQITFADLKKEHSFDWLSSGIKAYKPDAEQVAYLQKKLGEYDMVIFMGTWCDDSHYLIPKLCKVMEQSNYRGKYTLYGVDRAKTTKTNAHKEYKITLVPTIILLRDGNEAGRITETVKTSIEGDLADIIRKDEIRSGR